MAAYTGTTTLESLQGAHRYNKWIVSHFLSYLRGPAIEIGAGIGNISEEMLHISPLYISDVDPFLVKALKHKFGKKKHIYPITLDITKKLPEKLKNRFYSVIAINVLEHIQDDNAALLAMRKLLKKNGYLLLLVPAKKYAYTKLDKALGHYRRYEKKDMEEILQHAGFSVEKVYYFNITGLLGWILRDKIDKNHTHLKPYQVKTFELLIPFLRILEKGWKPFVGISIIVIAKRK